MTEKEKKNSFSEGSRIYRYNIIWSRHKENARLEEYANVILMMIIFLNYLGATVGFFIFP